MTYTVKEMYYTLQGVGVIAGRPAVFLRFAGCNLWTGREEDRAKGPGGCSRWCDTDFVGTHGPNGGRFTSPDSLAQRVGAIWGGGEGGRRLVVCTGGEPLLQLDEPLIEALHAQGMEVAIETNGTRPVPRGVDWVCVSPKAGSQLCVRTGDELKLVFPQEGLRPEDVDALDFRHFLLQPMDGAARELNTSSAVQYCLAHPQWKLSLQTHKFLGIA
jgi:7-carboxy-7-deazaguanine synthase